MDPTNMSHDERQHQGIEVSGVSTGIFGDITNFVISKDFHINLITLDISVRHEDQASIGVRTSQTADRKGHALLVAAQQGRTEVAQQLLEDGADWKYTEPDEQTALFRAVHSGHADVVKLLLSSTERQSYFVSSPERHFLDTPLYRAAVCGSTDIVRILLSYHPRIDAIQRNGFTAFQLAVRKGHTEIAKMLIEKDTNVYHENNNRATALHIAAKNGHMDVLKTLLEKDSSTTFLEHRNQTGDIALFLAVSHSRLDCARMLIQYGASVHAANNDQANLLHVMIAKGLPPGFLKELLSKFSLEEIKAENRLGRTRLDVAFDKQRPKFIALLKSRLERG